MTVLNWLALEFCIRHTNLVESIRLKPDSVLPKASITSDVKADPVPPIRKIP